MSGIEADFGWGNEAIEIGLKHANDESDLGVENPVSQVFIIGDAPPNTIDDVKVKRKNKSWVGTKYENETNYMAEVQKLKDKNINVFTFYVKDLAKNVF